MALNLKTLAVRSLSSVVFVILLLGSVLFSYYSFSLFFLTVSMLGLNEFFNLSQKLQAQPYRIPGFISGLLIYLSFINFDYLLNSECEALHYVVLLAPFFILSVALFSRREHPVQNALFTIAGIIYAVLPFGLLHSLVTTKSVPLDATYFPHVLLGIIFLIWSNDTFAYLGGSLFGKNKMIERISPGKTWEGTLFGVLVTFGISFLIRFYLIGDEGMLWPVLGITVPVLATVGDLIESMIKRQAGVKDTGNIMPGHGGVLDRFDSLIFVSPFVYALIHLV